MTASPKPSAASIARDLDLGAWQYRWGISRRQLSQLWALPEARVRAIVTAGDGRSIFDLPSLETMQHYQRQIEELTARMERLLQRETNRGMAARYRCGEAVMALHLRQMQRQAEAAR